jgi:hypothetical protein
MNRYVAFLAFCLAWTAHGPLRATDIYFPQTADGRADPYVVTTFFTLTNPDQDPRWIEINFYKDDGQTWSLELRSEKYPSLNGPRSRLTWQLQSYESLTFHTAGINLLASGWTRIRSDRPLMAQSSYLYRDNSQITLPPIWEAGVLPSTSTMEHSFVADRTTEGSGGIGIPLQGLNIDTGVAIANPSGVQAFITAKLYRDDHPNTMASIANILLPPLGHKAIYVHQLFQQYSWPKDFHGMVLFSSNVNIAVVALKQTSGGGRDVFSVIPVVPEDAIMRDSVYDEEPNDTGASAQTVRLPAEITGTLNSPSDSFESDWYTGQVNTIKESVLEVSVLSHFVGYPTNTYLYLYDSRMIQRGYMAYIDFPGGGDPVLRSTFLPGEVFYVKIESARKNFARKSIYKLFLRTRDLPLY